jgi:mRNA-degrading endonuclease RelE of RelBE toxin-antitoxin system
MKNMDDNIEIRNPCSERRSFCANCRNEFMSVRPSIKGFVVSKHFIRDLKNEEEANSIVKDVLDCSHLEFTELHKFEENVNGNLIFRAKKGSMHIIYGVDRTMKIIFLRAIKNFTEYKRFLDDKKEIKKMIERSSGL